MTKSWYPHCGFLPILAYRALCIWLSFSASEYKRSSGMTVKASSNKPGFSYLVGVTDKTCSKLQNFTEALSCGRRGIIGNRRFIVDVVCVESENADCDGAGEAVRDLDCECCCWKSLNRLLRIKFSKSLESSVASKSAVVEPVGLCDLDIAAFLLTDALCKSLLLSNCDLLVQYGLPLFLCSLCISSCRKVRGQDSRPSGRLRRHSLALGVRLAR